MNERALGRRQLLMGAGVAAGGVVATGVGLAGPAAASDGHRLTGSWLAYRRDDGDEMSVQLVISFAGSDVILTQDIQPAGPTFTGTVSRHGSSFQATIWSGFPGEDPEEPGVTVRVTLEGGVHDGTLSGTYTVTVFDSTGAEVDSVTGTIFDGHRIDAG